MSPRFTQFVLVILAFGMMAAQTLCACPTPAKASRPAPPAGQRCDDPCCVAAANKPVSQSGPDQGVPCENCNVMHPADQIQPERHDVANLAGHLFLALLPVPLLTPADGIKSLAAGAERIPIVNQPRDLFHSRVLLLV